MWWCSALLVGLAGAEPAEACQYPSVVSFRAFETKCTGTLVHPEVVVTAAHCLEGTEGIRVRFGEDFSPREFLVESELCVMHPEYEATRSAAVDIGVCRLAEPVQDVPVTPLAVGCELDALLVGTEATIVGFGVTPAGEDFGFKRFAVTEIASAVADDGTLEIGDASTGGCVGDSGGPALVRYPDGVWRVAAVLSTNPACGTGPGRFVTVRDHLEWLEEASERPLAPCNAAGCTADFETDPTDITDAWPARCRGPVAQAQQTCEDAPPEAEDSAPAEACACRGGGSPFWLAFLLPMLPIRRRRNSRKARVIPELAPTTTSTLGFREFDAL